MLRFRLTYTIGWTSGSFPQRDVWVGQQWDAFTETWEDRTHDYPTSQEAELALLRDFVGVEMEPVFER